MALNYLSVHKNINILESLDRILNNPLAKWHLRKYLF